MAATDVLPTFRQARGVKEHGTATVGTSAVVLQVANDDLLSLMIQVESGGNVRAGTSSVSSVSPNAPKAAVGDTIVLDRSADATYIVADQAGTVVTWLREVEA